MNSPTPKQTALPKIGKGYKRRYCRCVAKGCGRVSFYDYVPYSLSNPIMVTVCGHGVMRRDYALETITRAEFYKARRAGK
jgi:hypothetical protein